MTDHIVTLYVVIVVLLLLERSLRLRLSTRDFSIVLLDFVVKGIYLFVSLYVLDWLVYVLPAPPFLSLSSLPVPLWLNAILSFLVIDFCHYWLHRISHQMSWLWRLHRLHHSDHKVDALTTLLHHPLEAVFAFFLLISAYVVLDIPVPVIVAYGMVFTLYGPLTHVSLYLPDATNRWLSRLIVTPNFHKVHHSMDFAESNSNYGAMFTVWDYLFGTAIYRNKRTIAKQEDGISAEQTPNKTTLWHYLLNPFKS
jgi:sterol desaturase/sphingolipid hydroxylase (fatty acid hydroxylase superfamily)